MMAPDSLLVIASPLCALFAGIACLFAWGKPRPQRCFNLIGSLAHLVFAGLLLAKVIDAGPQVLRLGGWVAPYGIVYVADLFGAILLVVSGVLASLVAIYNFNGGIDEKRERFAYHALAQFLVFGVSSAFVTGDIFNLYVCFEILLMSSFGMLVLGNEKRQLAGALKYLVLNLMGSALFLTAVGLLYAQMGTLNFADLSRKLATFEELPVSLQILSHLLFVAFGIKAGLFPLFFWLPASYHTPPVPVTALFAGLLTKVGVYSLIRLYTFLFPHAGTGTFEWLWWISALTMVVGVVGAVSKNHIRKILSVHIISQVGYITLALALHTPTALAAGIFYMVHNMIAKTGLFLVGGVVESVSGTDSLKENGGLFKALPLLSALFLVLALGLAGLPPLSGFFAKLFVISAAAEISSYGSIFFALSVSVFTLFSMLKIWNEVFWKASPGEAELPLSSSFARSALTPQMFSVACLALMVLAMGLWSSELFEISVLAAEEMMNPTSYIEAVLGSAEGGALQ